MIKIGPHEIKTKVFLAPMSGISDLPYRVTARRLGCGYVVSEMVASEELAHARPDVVLRAALDEDSSPKVVQLAGREAKWMAEGAKIAQGQGADIIDINMGCPARKVTGLLSGSALMRDLDHALTLIEATVQAVSVPVTLKMRLGWDWQSLNAPELASRAEEAGVQMLTVHGRTRCDFYKGTANWAAIRAVKEATRLPLVANGDIACAAHAKKALEQSGADAVMVGRAAVGRPWLPVALDQALKTGGEVKEPPFEERGRVALAHNQATIAHYRRGHGQGPELGEELGVRMARKHLAALVDAAPEFSGEEARALKTALCQEPCPKRVEEQLRQAFGSRGQKAAA